MSEKNNNQGVSDDLLETFNRHYDQYLERYGLVPKRSVQQEEEPEEQEVQEETPASSSFPEFPVSTVEPEVEEGSVGAEEDTSVEVETETAEPEPEVEELVEVPEVNESSVFEDEEADADVADVISDETPEVEQEPEDEFYDPSPLPEEDEFYVESPSTTIVDEEEDLYYDPETTTTVVDEEDDLYYDPQATDEDVVEEEPQPEPEPEAVTPAPNVPVVEREIVREVLVVDREQARDLGYSADKYLDEKEHPVASSRETVSPATQEPRIPTSSSSLRDEVRAVAEAKQRARAKEEKSSSGGIFGFFRRQKEDTASTVEETYQEVSRVREEGLDNEFIGGVDDNTPISLKTQDGYDAREERLRLQHVNTERRDVDPAVWLEETMLDALKLNASDLHIIVDGETRDLRARIRVDGQMRDFDYVQGVPARVIMGRLKAATEFSSGGSFAPEETIYTIELNGEPRKARAVLFRVEDGGEALVMRLPLTGNLKHLHELDFADYNLQFMYDLLAMPYKLIMIAGPMGSGKTTTAHGALLHVAKPTRTVWTIEDPVERRLPNVVQLEIDEENEAGFDVLLSKLLRADYNTLFLGEIRDAATASAAVRQAKAGRQVMSTIHADDNIKAMMRLIELAGDSPMSVLSAVGGIISQRLVRRLNPDWDGKDPETKYKGRVPIHEILFIDDEIVEVMMEERPLSEIKQATRNARGSTFAQDAVRLIEAGITDREEIVSVIGEFETPEK